MAVIVSLKVCRGAPVVVGQDLPGFDVRDGSLHDILDFI